MALLDLDELILRELQPCDLEALSWAGGPAHQRALEEALHASWEGEVEVIVVELPNQRVIAHGGLDYRDDPSFPKVWMLAVHEAWRSLGVGSALLAELELRAGASGAERVFLTVEEDNPRAKALYLGAGYVPAGSVVETWPLDDGRLYACVADVLVKDITASSTLHAPTQTSSER